MNILSFVNKHFIQFSLTLFIVTTLAGAFTQIYDGYLEEINREQWEIFRFAGRLLGITIED